MRKVVLRSSTFFNGEVDHDNFIKGKGKGKRPPDGVHFDAAGNALVHRHVAAALAKVGLAPSALTSHMPHFLHLAAPTLMDWDGNRIIGAKR